MAIRSAHDLTDFLIGYTRDMAVSDEDPGAILDRYFVPDFAFCNDGLVIDRRRMVDHAGPVRKNVDREAMAAADRAGLEIHEALVSGDRFAARYTLRTRMRKGATFAAEIYMFGRLAPDARIARVDQVTRELAEK